MPATLGMITGMPQLVVQKYGGSSLADADRIRHVARRISRERAAGSDLVVIVSAMGDTTDHLLELAGRITDDPDPREMDLLLATGEHMSGTLMAMALQAIGVPAISLTGAQAGIRTDASHGRARIANVDPVRVQDEIAAGKVVIVAGFQGATDESHRTGEVTTLGRGGSDTTAVALAARLEAGRCEIYTDVEGIYTCDPRVVPDARLLPTIGYEEMLELAHQGAQVMQTRAVELGWVNGVVIAVRSTFSDHPGTLIQEAGPMEIRDKVRGLALDRKVAKVTLVGVPDRPGIARAVFDPLAESGINIDLIVQNVGHAGATDLSFTVPAVELARVRRLLDPIVRDLGFADMTTDAAVAKVSVVGAGIGNTPGYAARMFGALADAGINIEMISTSEIRITCIIAEDQVDEAARALHRAFSLEAAGCAGCAGGRRARVLSAPVPGPALSSERARSIRREARAFREHPVDPAHRAWLAGRAARPRSPSRSRMSRPPGWAGSAVPGPRRLARRSSCPLGSAPRTSPHGTPGGSRRPSRWRCSMPPRTWPAFATARSGSSGPTTSWPMGPMACSARWPASWARRRSTTTVSSPRRWASASTATGPSTTSRPTSRPR